MNKKAKNRAMVLGAAVLGLAAAASNAGVTMTITDVGDPKSSAGVARTDYQAYLITVATDVVGDKITGISFNPAELAGLGIYGQIVQRTGWDSEVEDWVIPTPYSTTKNNGTGTFSYDSHFLFSSAGSGVTFFPVGVAEDNNLVGLANYEPDVANDRNYGTGAQMVGAIGLSPTLQAASVEVAYVILPDAAAGTARVSVATSVSGVVTPPAQTFGPAGGEPPPANKVGLIVGEATQPGQGDVTVSGGNGKYVSTIFDDPDTAVNIGSIDVLGTLPTPGTDPVYVLLDLSGVPDLAALKASLQNLGTVAFTPEIAADAGTEFEDLASHYTAPTGSWDLLLKFAGTGAAPGGLDFAWDFAFNTGVVVEGAVVVPEPSMLGLAAIGGLGLLARRRRA